MYSPELNSKLAIFRQKVADNTITDEELQEGVALLRQERKSAVVNSAKKKSAAARAPAKSADDLLSELEGM